MMDYDVNPFQVLYVTDSPDPGLFVELFSDLPVQFSQPVFQAGNVVLKGTQGSGKSMLLNLLKPQIRLAYAKEKVPFPVPPKLGHFVGAGINLTLSGALDIGQRPVTSEENERLYPLFFGDFINFFVVRDLLRSIELMANEPIAFDSLVNPRTLDSFASELSKQDCWFGSLKGCRSFQDLIQRIDERIAMYRSFHQFNSDLPQSVYESKTNIGEPIARSEEALKAVGCISIETQVFVRIDQLERLYRSDVLRPQLGMEYRRIINKALGKRDSRVSYRIGTRPYAWEDDLTVFGTDDKLEHIRDYRVVDLDEKMRRTENARKAWLFPGFAEDAFRRRVKLVKLNVEKQKDCLRAVFGDTPSPSDVAKIYAKNSDPDKVLKLPPDWSKEWQDFLRDMYQEDPFTAVLATAWAKQRGQSGAKGKRVLASPPKDRQPWRRTTWRKERTRQGLLQIATRCAQRLRWSGKDTILSLSAPNISVFLSVCHEIWDAFLRSERRKNPSDRTDPLRKGMSADLQSIGIETASKDWYSKISELPSGHDRQRFVQVLGIKFKTWLLEDIDMSYPGQNGFSLAIDDLTQYPSVARFLADATDYGDLFGTEHTTKGRDRIRRRKWYLSPILSPFFQIPEVHTKEPHYAKITDVIEWLQEAKVYLKGLPVLEKQDKTTEPLRDDPQKQFIFSEDAKGSE